MNFDTMTEQEIVDLALSKGYGVYNAPVNDNQRAPGKRIGGSLVRNGPDLWMNAANNRLWRIQLKRAWEADGGVE